MLLAAGLALGGYCLLLALRREPLPAPPAPTAPTAPTGPPVLSLPPLPLPERLATSPEFASTARAANAAGARPQRPAPIAVTLRVRNVQSAWRTEHAGVAVMPVDGSTGFAWLPLPAQTAANGDVLLAHTVLAAGDVTITVAAGPAFAMHGYLSRTHAAVGAAGGTIDVDASATRVVLELPGSASSAPLLCLARSDDPHWLPAALAPTGLSIEPGQPRQVWLGAGRYELRDPLQPERLQQFEVPRDAVVVVSASLTRARADRP